MLEPFYAMGNKKDWVKGQKQKKLTIWNVKESKAHFCFRRFKEGDTRLEDNPRSGRESAVENEILLQMGEQ